MKGVWISKLREGGPPPPDPPTPHSLCRLCSSTFGGRKKRMLWWQRAKVSRQDLHGSAVCVTGAARHPWETGERHHEIDRLSRERDSAFSKAADFALRVASHLLSKLSLPGCFFFFFSNPSSEIHESAHGECEKKRAKRPEVD